MDKESELVKALENEIAERIARIILYIVSLVMVIAAVWILVEVDWHIALGVFLWSWGRGLASGLRRLYKSKS